MDLESLKQAAEQAEQEWQDALKKEEQAKRESYLRYKIARAASQAYFDARWDKESTLLSEE